MSDQMVGFFVSLGDLLLGVSDTLELSSPMISRHQHRVALVAGRMAEALALSEASRERMLMAALLHDIGALSPEEKISLHTFEDLDAGRHCDLGAYLFRQAHWLEAAAPIVQWHHGGWPEQTEGDAMDLVTCAQILFLADHVERWIDRGTYILHQSRTLRSRVEGLLQEAVAREIVDAFAEVSACESFWLDLASHRSWRLLHERLPTSRVTMEASDALQFSQMLRNVVDFRSPFTATHSSGVAPCARLLAQRVGFSDEQVQMMEVCGNLHDLGKMAVPNAVLNKRGGLTDAERRTMMQHPYHTYVVLSRVSCRTECPEWAAFHHERLDGSGYPFHRTAENLDTGARLMAVADVITAVTEHRAYRRSMDKAGAVRILRGMAGREHLDWQLVDLAVEHVDEICELVERSQEHAAGIYQSVFAESDTSVG